MTTKINIYREIDFFKNMNTKASVMFKLFFALIVVFLFSIVLINGISAAKTDKIDKINRIAPAAVKDSGIADVIVIFKDGVEEGLKTSEISTLASKGMQIKSEYSIINGAHILIPNSQLDDLRNSPIVDRIDIDEAKYHVLLNVSVPLINGIAAQTLYNGSGVNVCVLDTGIDFWHKNLPTPIASADFTDWDWCIQGKNSNTGINRSYNYYLNITNPSLDWLEVGANWDHNNNRYDLFVYYPNGTQAGNTTGLPTINETKPSNASIPLYWIKFNITDINGYTGNWTILINETSINQSDTPTLLWGSNVSYDFTFWGSPRYCGQKISPVNNPTSNDTRAFYNIITSDDYGHGTHVAGIIASNDTPYKGVAPSVTLLVAKVIDSDNIGTTTSILGGIQWCIDNNASIMSMSFGGDDDNNCNFDDVIAIDNAAINYNILSVIAAGNGNGATTINEPGCAKTAITVGSTDNTDNFASFESQGPTNGTAIKRVKPDIVAPGVNIYSTYITNRFATDSGTSMSTPFVTGVAAMLKQQNPNLTASEVKAMLMVSANKTKLFSINGGETGSKFDPSNIYGTGRVEALKAINGTSFIRTINMTGGQSISYKMNVTNSSTGLFVAANWNENTSGTHYIITLNLTDPNTTVADTSTNPNNTIQQVGKFSPAAGIWTITIKNVNNTNRTVSIASTYNLYSAPEVYLLSPPNNNITQTRTWNFTYRVNETMSNLSYCQLYGNFTGTWAANQSNSTPVVNYAANNVTSNNFTMTNLSNGIYIWNVYCNNTDGDTGFSSKNYSIGIDTLAPNITIITPVNNYNTSGNITLNWSIYDVSNTTLKYSVNKTTNSTLYSNKTGAVNISVAAGLNQNITVYVNDSFNQKSSTIVIFNIDRTSPNLTVLNPNNGTSINATSVDINYTTNDNLQLDNVWYKLENGTAVDITPGNSSTNLTFPGNYTLEVYVNDSVGNINHVTILFSTVFNMNMTNWTQNLLAGAPEIKMINITLNGLNVTYNSSTSVDGNMTMFVNTTKFNITFTNFNGLGANWVERFNVTETNSSVTNTISNIGSNASKLIYISNANEFLSNNEYNGIITFFGNTSNYTDFFYCEPDVIFNSSHCVKISGCASFNGTACYNDSATTTTVYVPHFSAVVAAVDTKAPSITVNSPTNTTYPHPSTAFALKANLTTSADTVYCNMSLMANGSFTKPSDSKTNYTFTNGSTSYVWTIGPLHNGTYNITISCNDTHGNTNTTTKYFTVNDATKPEYSDLDMYTVGVDYGTVQWSSNEPVNRTIKYGTDDNHLTNNLTNASFGTFERVKIDNLNDNDEYFFNITGCDYTGNCNTTGPYNFTTDKNTTNTTNEAGEGGGGGGGGNQTNTTTIVKAWATIDAYEKNTMTISSSSIPLSKISFVLNTNTQNSELTVKSLGNTLPSGLTNLPAPVYKYFSITASLSIRNSMTLATVVTKVTKSYIANNNYNYSTVTIYNNDGTNWEKLNTVLIDTTGDYYSYEANTTHFSTFAIIMTPNIETYTPANQTITQTQNQSNVTNITNQTGGIGIGSEQTTDYTIPIIIVIIVAAVAGILIVLYKKGIIFGGTDYYTPPKRPLLQQKQVYKPKSTKKNQQEQGLFDGLKKGVQKQDDGPELFKLK